MAPYSMKTETPEGELLGAQNVFLNITAPRNEVSAEADMLKLLGAEVFLVSVQPAEKELQASNDDHAGPLHLEGKSKSGSVLALSSFCREYLLVCSALSFQVSVLSRSLVQVRCVHRRSVLQQMQPCCKPLQQWQLL